MPVQVLLRARHKISPGIPTLAVNLNQRDTISTIDLGLAFADSSREILVYELNLETRSAERHNFASIGEHIN
jgi:hypothetical protein